MKRTTYVCDCCGREGQDRMIVVSVHTGNTQLARADVCDACAQRVTKLVQPRGTGPEKFEARS